MISLRPSVHAVRKAVRAPAPDLEDVAVERWTIAPPVKRFIPPAICLPGQLDRIRGTEFAPLGTVLAELRGGFEAVQEATEGFRVRNVDLVDGVLYAGNAVRHLRRRHRFAPAYASPREVVDGSLYESPHGNLYFGCWLSEDTVSYPLAERFGTPVTTRTSSPGHIADYEARLGMRPRRFDHVRFDELILFHQGQNECRKALAEDVRRRLTADISCDPHPGVFLLRGSGGARRLLINELQIAERLANKWGFRVLDPMKSSVEDIIAACAGARVVAGIEGSHINHGLTVMPPDAALLMLQPPQRTVAYMKTITDRQGQGFAVVVGSGGREVFTVDWDDVERTLGLMLG